MKRTLIVNGTRFELTGRQLVEARGQLRSYQAAGVELREWTQAAAGGWQVDYEIFTLDWDPAPHVVLELWSPLLLDDDADIREPGFVRRFQFGRRVRARVRVAGIPEACGAGEESARPENDSCCPCRRDDVRRLREERRGPDGPATQA